MKILIVDDEQAVIEDLKRVLKKMKWNIMSATNFKDAVGLLLAEKFDVIILDHHFPCEESDQQGLDIVKEIRNNKINTPVIILTGCDTSKIKPWDAFNIGVDDFVRKPYHPEEIIARVKAMSRRAFPSDHNSTNIIEFEELSLDLDKKKLFIDGSEVNLSSTLFLLITKLLKSKGRFLSYEDLIKYIWGESALYEKETNNTLRVHISYLRKSLGKYGKHIKTVHGRGFIWEGEEK